MEIVVLLYVFILGAIVGSFLNVVALRYNTGMSIISGRSQCFHCSTPLKWYELIPVVSYISSGGKCRHCSSKISPRYFLVEILAGLIFVGILVRHLYYLPMYSVMFDNSLFYIYFLFISYIVAFSLLLVIGLYDLRHMIIPDKMVYLFIFVSSLKLILFLSYKINSLNLIDIFDALAPFILVTPFYLLWFFSKGRLIGFGDIKLVFGIGALLGLALGTSSIVLAFWIGAVWSVGLLVLNKFKKENGISMKSEVPFAPFLIAGTLLIFFTQVDIFGLESLIQLL